MSVFGPYHFQALKNPEALFLLIGVALLLVAELTVRPAGVLSVSTGDVIRTIRSGRKDVARRAPAVLRALGLTFLIIALARPLSGMRARVESAHVRDIMLAVDVSGSMTAPDFVDSSGARRDRLYVVKQAVRDFVTNRKARPEDRYGTDRLGLLLYASYAWIQTPLTLDYKLLERDLDDITIDQRDEKHNRTAIGSAIGLAVSNLNKSPAKSRVVVLLTDGINNHGSLDPVTAAELAKKFGMKVYTIGAGSPEARSAVARDNPIDEETMKKIAEITGAKYYRGNDLTGLQQAYNEINALETSEIKMGEVYDFDESFMPYLVTGLLLTAAGIFSRRLWFEAIP